MQTIIMDRLLVNRSKQEVKKIYEALTGETITQEEIDNYGVTTKKKSILKIEKNLLDKYCESVADIKRLKQELLLCYAEDSEDIEDRFNAIISKHAKHISDSDIWK